MCSNGRWGTVCGDRWTEREAGLLCSRLGFPTLSKAMVVQYKLCCLYAHIDATISNFGEGSGPLYDITCPSTGSDDQECVPTLTSAPSRCNHSMDVGVRCLSYEDAYVAAAKEATTMQTTRATSCDVLGALVGLLAVVLMAVVAGWILASVYFQRKINK